jgi:rSAM/selenodomain-associated transferase 1
VIAKAPVPGRVKTRLTPPCTPEQAAALARAALRDTFAAARRTRHAGRRVAVLDGEPGPWLPREFEVIPQRGEGLGERLAAAFDDVGEPAFLIGMDTPQVTPQLLDAGLLTVAWGGSAFGPALDGGYWGIGLRTPDAAVFDGVPMSTARTGRMQRARMVERDLDPGILPALRDVDTYEVALEVAAEAPHTHFACALAELDGIAA